LKFPRLLSRQNISSIDNRHRLSMVDGRLSMVGEDIDALSPTNHRIGNYPMLPWITSGALCAMCVQVGVTISFILLGEGKPAEHQ